MGDPDREQPALRDPGRGSARPACASIGGSDSDTILAAAPDSACAVDGKPLGGEREQ